MKKLLFLFLLMTSGLYFSQINTEEIKENVTENPHKYFYDYLEIFKKDPSKLSQDEMNQLYYGSRFIKLDYNMSNYNDDYDQIWKPASRKSMPKSKAEKIIVKAEQSYSKNPLFKEILLNLSNIYHSLKDKTKKDLCISQYERIIHTIENSGTGNSEDSPICVIRAADVLDQLKKLKGYGVFGGFQQQSKQLPDGSLLTKYEMGKKQVFVKLVGGFMFD